MSNANRTIDLAGTQILKAADGTAAAPSITNDGDTNTGMFFPAADTIAFSEGGTEAMRIDSSGNVGVGNTNPSNKLQVTASTPASVPAAGSSSHCFAIGSSGFGIASGALNSGNGYIQATRWDGTATDYNLLLQPNGGNVGIGTSSPSSAYRATLTGNGSTIVGGLALSSNSNVTYIGATGATAADSEIWNSANGYVRIGTNNTERLRIDASGNVLVGTTSTGHSSGEGIKITPSGDGAGVPRISIVTPSTTNNQNNGISFYSTGAAAYRFYVGAGGTVFATNTTISAISDIRYKENIRDLDVGLGAIMELKPRVFDWKDGKGKNIKNDRGFVAQEFEQVFPGLVDEWQDDAPQGEEPYKSVRQDLIPVLVKAIQELKAKNDILEAKVTALEEA